MKGSADVRSVCLAVVILKPKRKKNVGCWANWEVLKMLFIVTIIY